MSIVNKKTYGSGDCTRSGDADGFAFDLIPARTLAAEAARWALGERGHGRSNWRRGQPVPVMVNHLLCHVNQIMVALERGNLAEELKRDDHIAAARCNLAMIYEYSLDQPHLFAPGEWHKSYRPLEPKKPMAPPALTKKKRAWFGWFKSFSPFRR